MTTDVTHSIKLKDGGFERIEKKIQTIENLTQTGIFSAVSTTSRFYTISSEIKKLRQILREELLIVPSTVTENSKGDAA